MSAFKSFVCPILVLISCGARAEDKTKRELIDRIVAIVDSKPILASEIRKKINPLTIRVSDYPTDSSADEITRALNDEINNLLVQRKIKELEIKVGHDEVEQQISEMLKHNNSTKSELLAFLRQQGKTYAEYSKDLEEQMLVHRFRGRVLMPLVRNAMQVNQAKIRAASQSKKTLAVRMREIFIKSPKQGEPGFETYKERCNELYQKLLHGADFLELEEFQSDNPTMRDKAPDKKYNLNDLVGELRSEIEKINRSSKNKFTKPIYLGNGWHIFLVRDWEYLASEPLGEEELQKQQMNQLNEQLNLWLKQERAKVEIRIINN